jgi:hypothetical protein
VFVTCGPNWFSLTTNICLCSKRCLPTILDSPDAHLVVGPAANLYYVWPFQSEGTCIHLILANVTGPSLPHKKQRFRSKKKFPWVAPSRDSLGYASYIIRIARAHIKVAGFPYRSVDLPSIPEFCNNEPYKTTTE